MTDPSLSEEFDNQQKEELGDLDLLQQWLLQYSVPKPNTDTLLEQLELRFVKKVYTPSPQKVYKERQKNIWYWIKLAKLQTTLLDLPFWGASALMMTIGVAIALLKGGDFLTLLFILLSPLLAACGVAYIFRSSTRDLWELERSSPTSFLELFYARLAIILFFNISISIPILLFAWIQGIEFILWQVLVVWLCPMIGLVGLALYISVRWNSLSGSIVPIGLWSIFIFFNWHTELKHNLLSMKWIASGFVNSNYFFWFLLFVLLLGVFLLRQSQRLLERPVAI